MSDVKLTLLGEKQHYAVGGGDLRRLINRPITTRGLMVLNCNRGRAVVTVNFRKQTWCAGDVLFLSPDMVLVVQRTSRNFDASYCSISSELATEATYNIPWDFYEFLYAFPVCRPTITQAAELMRWWQQLAWYVAEGGDGESRAFVRNAVQNLLLAIDREIKRDPEVLARSQRKDRAWVVLNQFYSLLAAHCMQERSVAFYADKLCITPYYLSKITGKLLSLTPKEIIDEQILVEIKVHLTCTTMSVKEIAEQLSFDDPSYMCRFFRRCTGVSLTRYRSEFR